MANRDGLASRFAKFMLACVLTFASCSLLLLLDDSSSVKRRYPGSLRRGRFHLHHDTEQGKVQCQLDFLTLLSNLEVRVYMLDPELVRLAHGDEDVLFAIQRNGDITLATADEASWEKLNAALQLTSSFRGCHGGALTATNDMGQHVHTLLYTANFSTTMDRPVTVHLSKLIRRDTYALFSMAERGVLQQKTMLSIARNVRFPLALPKETLLQAVPSGLSPRIFIPRNAALYHTQATAAPFVHCRQDWTIPSLGQKAYADMKRSLEVVEYCFAQENIDLWLARRTLLDWYSSCAPSADSTSLDLFAWTPKVRLNMTSVLRGCLKPKGIRILIVKNDHRTGILLIMFSSATQLRVHFLIRDVGRGVVLYSDFNETLCNRLTYTLRVLDIPLCKGEFLDELHLIPCNAHKILSLQYDDDVLERIKLESDVGVVKERAAITSSVQVDKEQCARNGFLYYAFLDYKDRYDEEAYTVHYNK